MERLTARQKKVLNRLLDKYEDSRTYTGENRVEQHFRVTPQEIWPQYGDDFADVAEVEEFEREIRTMRDRGLVETEERSGRLRKIRAVKEKLPVYYELLERRGKRELQDDEISLYREYARANDPLGRFCRDQLTLLEDGKKARYPAEKAALLLELLRVILLNGEELYERELSIRILHDSKRFAAEYRTAVCDILRKYGDYEGLLQGETEKRTIQEILLEEHLICANPGYIYVKGTAEFRMADGGVHRTEEGLPVAFSTAFMKEVRSVHVQATRVITVENLTSFHRFDQKGFFVVYLSGYHSSRITRFLHRIEAPENHEWLHFGDLDPDGFLILKNLCRKTGMEFRAWQMSADILRRFRGYTRPLTEQDRAKAEKMLKEGYYPEEMRLMLEEGIKLEQEAIGAHGISTGRFHTYPV